MRAAIQSSFNQALAETLEWNAVDYDSLVRIERDGEGEHPSASRRIRGSSTCWRGRRPAIAMTKLNAACAQGVGVPLGAFTGIDWLAGYGPRVTLRILPVGRGAVRVRLFLCLRGRQSDAALCLAPGAGGGRGGVLPGGSEEIEEQVSALVCENVIVGKVPDIYLQGAGSLSASSA